MADEDSIEQTENKKEEDPSEVSSDSEEDSDYDSDDSSVGSVKEYAGVVKQSNDEEAEDENSPEANVKRFTEVLFGRRLTRKRELDDKKYVFYEDLFDFPKDPEKWREEDLKELWADAPLKMTRPGWDPVWADEDDWEVVKEERKAGSDPPIAPFYIPYRKYYPAIPNNHHDIANPMAVIEELDRIEEFLKWVSFIFPDGSSYEGTVWDDLAHGKGVYVAEHGLVRYEGEWLQNNMEGHGVVEVDVPDREPVPGSELEAKMREEGKIISRDFMSPEDREWLEMDIEDSYRLAGGNYEIPFDENTEWIKQFGQKPEKGRYRYAGQWKHGRMHGCGVYEVNEHPIYGRFYFGELLEDSTGCDENVSTLHAGIAEVAAAKARMFVNKPDGMIRQQMGPYSDPQHPYLYEGEDVWMAPGFINQFYEIPDCWKTYVHEVDEERGMWLNSFYKAPLRIPMPAELEYWWSKDESPEFVFVNKGPEPDPEDPSRLVHAEDPLILHTPTGRLINFVEDEEHGIRLFWQPSLKDGEEVEPNKVEYLPLGFDEFYEQTTSSEKKENMFEKAWKTVTEKIQKWGEETKKSSEMKLKMIEKELEFIEAELCLEETIEDMEMELKRKQQEEEKKVEMSQQEVEDTSAPVEQDGLDYADEDEEDDGAPTSFGSVAVDTDSTKNDEGNKRGKQQEEKKVELSRQEVEDASAPTEQDGLDSAEEDEDEEEEDVGAPTSFGSVAVDKDSTKNDKGNKRGKSPFSASSLSFASCSLVSTVPFNLQKSFVSWKNGVRCPTTKPICPQTCPENFIAPLETVSSVRFPRVSIRHSSLKAGSQDQQRFRKRSARLSPLHSLSRLLLNPRASTGQKRSQREQKTCTLNLRQKPSEIDLHNILSLQFPINCPGT